MIVVTIEVKPSRDPVLLSIHVISVENGRNVSHSEPSIFSIFDPTIFVFSGLSRNGMEYGMEVFGIGTETGWMFFHPYLRNSVFGRNFFVFVPDYKP